jgi:hypothetical protein
MPPVSSRILGLRDAVPIVMRMDAKILLVITFVLKCSLRFQKMQNNIRQRIWQATQSVLKKFHQIGSSRHAKVATPSDLLLMSGLFDQKSALHIELVHAVAVSAEVLCQAVAPEQRAIVDPRLMTNIELPVPSRPYPGH